MVHSLPQAYAYAMPTTKKPIVIATNNRSCIAHTFDHSDVACWKKLYGLQHKECLNSVIRRFCCYLGGPGAFPKGRPGPARRARRSAAACRGRWAATPACAARVAGPAARMSASTSSSCRSALRMSCEATPEHRCAASRLTPSGRPIASCSFAFIRFSIAFRRFSDRSIMLPLHRGAHLSAGGFNGAPALHCGTGGGLGRRPRDGPCRFAVPVRSRRRCSPADCADGSVGILRVPAVRPSRRRTLQSK